MQAATSVLRPRMAEASGSFQGIWPAYRDGQGLRGRTVSRACFSSAACTKVAISANALDMRRLEAPPLVRRR